MGRIRYPKKGTEFEIQAELYGLLKQFCDVRGEVGGKYANGSKAGRCRFDLVVFDKSRKAVAIIECKKSRCNRSFFLSKDSEQHRRYLLFGLPVIRCGNKDQYPGIIERVSVALGLPLPAHAELFTRPASVAKEKARFGNLGKVIKEVLSSTESTVPTT